MKVQKTVVVKILTTVSVMTVNKKKYVCMFATVYIINIAYLGLGGIYVVDSIIFKKKIPYTFSAIAQLNERS